MPIRPDTTIAALCLALGLVASVSAAARPATYRLDDHWLTVDIPDAWCELDSSHPIDDRRIEQARTVIEGNTLLAFYVACPELDLLRERPQDKSKSWFILMALQDERGRLLRVDADLPEFLSEWEATQKSLIEHQSADTADRESGAGGGAPSMAHEGKDAFAVYSSLRAYTVPDGESDEVRAFSGVTMWNGYVLQLVAYYRQPYPPSWNVNPNVVAAIHSLHRPDAPEPRLETSVRRWIDDIDIDPSMLKSVGGAGAGIIAGLIVAMVGRVLWAVGRASLGSALATVRPPSVASAGSIQSSGMAQRPQRYGVSGGGTSEKAADIHDVLSRLLAAIELHPQLGDEARKQIFYKARMQIMAVREISKSLRVEDAHQHGFSLYSQRWLKDNAQKLWDAGVRQEEDRHSRGIEAVADAYALYLTAIYLAAQSVDAAAGGAAVAAKQIEQLTGLS